MEIDRVNFGVFYTPQQYISIIWREIEKYIDQNTTILDSSCGQGDFFRKDISTTQIGVDVDSDAIQKAKSKFPNVKFFSRNSLLNVSRDTFGIEETRKLIIIGNPPYNDITSLAKKEQKTKYIEMDSDIVTRDYGMSFLLSYSKLNSDIIAILHPLSYLIKKANFNLLKKFTNRYRLVKGIVVSSSTFYQTSKSNPFPILIATYESNPLGMDFEFIRNFEFQTIEGKKFRIKDFDYIPNYIRKYPLKKIKYRDGDILFWTMRDLNALKRNRTFVKKYSTNTIVVDIAKLDYYVYVDVVKHYSSLFPYYFGNLDIIIDNEMFKQYRDYFIQDSLNRWSFLNSFYTKIDMKLETIQTKIREYFKNLLGDHYVNLQN